MDTTLKYTYTLQNSVTDDKGFEIKEITVRQATVGDFIASEELGKNAGDQRRTLNFFALLSGMGPQSLEKIYLKDWLRFTKGANDFLGLDSSL